MTKVDGHAVAHLREMNMCSLLVVVVLIFLESPLELGLVFGVDCRATVSEHFREPVCQGGYCHESDDVKCVHNFYKVWFDAAKVASFR